MDEYHETNPNAKAEPLRTRYWKPIETAPKDGTEILIWNGKTVVAASWGYSHDGDYNNPRWEPSHVGALWTDSVTHWMPLPSQPNKPMKDTSEFEHCDECLWPTVCAETSQCEAARVAESVSATRPAIQSHKDGHDTEREAAESLAPFSGTHARIVYRLLQQFRLTAHEIAGRTALNSEQVKKRLSDLNRLGWIEDSGYRSKTPSGRSCIIWQSVGGEDLPRPPAGVAVETRIEPDELGRLRARSEKLLAIIETIRSDQFSSVATLELIDRGLKTLEGR